MNCSSARTLIKGIAWLGIALLMPTYANADIYKWVDAQGQVHFADSAPKSANATILLKEDVGLLKEDADAKPAQETTRASATADVSSQTLLERQQRFALQLEQERKQREATLAKEKQQKEKYDLACQRAKNRLDHFKSVNRFYHENQDGTVRYLTDKEGDRFRREAQAAYHEHCAGAINIAGQ